MSGKGGRRRCGRCRKMREIAIRAKDGEPDICTNCRPRRKAPCGICGRVGKIVLKASEASPAIGRCCYQPPLAVCGVCDKERPCYHAGDSEPICPSCASARRRSVCLDCGRELRARLRRYGISAKAARRAALLELAARLPASILAERFGFHQARAAKWVREAGKNYADYAALRAGS